ncbi:MAG: hypothetical protein H7647_08105 [Candidatus Heimdallarchaeota archaeon]|nr:hypothetical protein [Candidatus Heimdallarchaeota archaeon]MCK4254389.1 hypothetical protein [Candidatus Heimdallarchaeota archaeon]
MKGKYIFALILIVGMITGMTSPTLAYETSITASGLTVAFDISHGGYHTGVDDLDPIMNNLTAAGNTVLFINETWELPDDVDILFLTQADDYYSRAELCDIFQWYNLGDKLIIASGDSDYGGYFDVGPINEVLDFVYATLRLDGSSIEDPVYNDGSAYRVAATEVGYPNNPEYNMPIIANLTEGIEAGVILHGPCGVAGYNYASESYISLAVNKNVIHHKVSMIMMYSENATGIDSDVSEQEWDIYGGVTGYIPAIVYEVVGDSHLIVAGEAFYTHYKFMYDQNTEQGTYNGGVHYGQMLTNNILNWFGPMFVEEASYEFAFAVIPLAIIGVVYVLMKKRK